MAKERQALLLKYAQNIYENGIPPHGILVSESFRAFDPSCFRDEFVLSSQSVVLG